MIKKLNSFNIDYTSEMEQRVFQGQFTSRIASMMDRSKISVRKSQLCGGFYVVRDEDGKPTGRGIDEDTEWQNYMFAYLETVLVQKPEWFKLEEIVDESLVLAVFKEVMSFEGTFRTGGRQAAQAGQVAAQGNTGASPQEPQVTVGGNAPKKMVGREVSAALDA